MQTISQIVLSMLVLGAAAATTSFTVAASKKQINTLSSYTFTIVFADSTARTSLTLYLPSSLTLTTSSTATLNTVLLNSTQSTLYPNNSTVTITASMANTTTVVISNVMNPNSDRDTYDFKISTNNAADTVGPFIYNLIDFQAGALNSCLYTFGGTTEQSNSTLTVTIQLGNPLQAGTNNVVVGYPITWASLTSKSLTYGSPTLTCSLSSPLASATGTCTYDSTSIYLSFSVGTQLTTNTTVTLTINNINSPPTVTTATSTSYAVSTKDSQGYFVDTLSSCNISETKISSLSGTFTNTALYINSQYNNPQINYVSTVPVTFQPGDSLQLAYPLTTSSCSGTIYLNRNTPTTWTLSGQASGIRTYLYSTSTSNSQASSVLQLYLDCSMTTPASAQPYNFSLLFQRNSINYLNLTAEYSALAVEITSSNKYQIILENSAAVGGPYYYIFTIVVGQSIGKNALAVLALPKEISFASFGNLTSCSANINGSPTTITACNYSTSTTTSAYVYLSAAAALLPNDILSITLRDLYNPNYAYTSFYFGLKTYYNSSISSSLVQYASALTSKQYTTYTTTKVYISPESFSVYSTTSINLTYNSQVYLPAGGVITWVLPTQVTNPTFNGFAYINDTIKQINESTVSTTPPTIVIKYYYDIPIGSNVTVPLSIRTPANLATYSPITLSVVNTAKTYQKSSILTLIVNQTSPMYAVITPSSSYTGAQTSLSFQLTSFMPHSTPYFYLIISKPTETTITPTSLSCSGNCLSAVSYLNSSSINVTMVNSYTTTSNYYTYTITVTGFTNPRHIGTSGWFTFDTYSNTGSKVASGTATMQVALPSPITAVLSKERRYYRGNTDSVVLYLTLSNVLTSTDYILLTFSTDTYTNTSSSVSCPLTEATCSISSQSTSNVLIVKAVPNQNQLSSKSVTLTLSGLTSSSSTLYNQVRYFNITSYNLNNQKVDQGAAAYNVSCGQHSSYNCKTCDTNGNCATCYLNEGMYMLSYRCVSNCSSETQYLTYTGTGVCLSCSGNCYTCFNSTACRSCLTGYYYYQNYSCLSTCPTSNGYYASNGYCFRCYDTTYCASCDNSSINACTACSGGLALQQGICVSGCTIANTYLSSSATCEPCNAACNGCTGAGSGACTLCNYGYYSSGGYCVSQCPTGTAAIISSQSCGCDAPCITCNSSSTYCLSCSEDSLGSARLAYFGSCVSSCPSYSYLSGVQCLPCTSGCSNCTATTCFLCDSDRYTYNDKCYQDCNLISQQYDGDNSTGVLKCVLCPEGCDSCQGYACKSCLSGYSLQNETCMLLCLVLGNCEAEVGRVLPVPGVLAVAVWVAVVVIVKLALGKAYVPYSILMFSALVEIAQVIILIAVLSSSDTSAASTTVSRLLLGMNYSYRLTIQALLLASLVLNYLLNLLFLLVFCKYLRPLLNAPKQIDLITNGIVLALATVTNYRLILLSFSRMFPKPWIPVDNSSKLTPVNYLCIVSLILDVLPLTASIMLIYKQTTGTNLFMLGVDLLIVLALNLIFTIYMVAVPKTEQYYDESLKKTNIEDNYKTEEDLKDNDKNVSMSKLVSNYEKNEHFSDELVNTHAHDNKNLLQFVATDNGGQPAINYGADGGSEPDNRVQNIHHQYRTARKENKTQQPPQGYDTFESDEKDIEEVIDFQHNKQEISSIAGSEPLQAKKTKRNPPKISPKSKPHLQPQTKKQLKKSPQPKKQVRQSEANKSPKPSQTQQSLHRKLGIQSDEDNLERKVRETTINYSKKIEKKKYEGKIKETESLGLGENTARIQDLEAEEENVAQAVFVKGKQQKKGGNQTSVNLPRKYRTRKEESELKREGIRQSEPKMAVKRSKVFLSGQGEDDGSSNSVDLDTILQSKIRESKRIHGKTHVAEQKKRDLSEDISPSWFNSQNQRIEVQDIQ